LKYLAVTSGASTRVEVLTVSSWLCVKALGQIQQNRESEMSGLDKWLHKMLDRELDERYSFPSWVFPRGDGSLASLMKENDNCMYHEEILNLLNSLPDRELLEIYNEGYYCRAIEAQTIAYFEEDLRDYGYDLPSELVDRQAELLEELEAFKEEESEGATNEWTRTTVTQNVR